LRLSRRSAEPGAGIHRLLQPNHGQALQVDLPGQATPCLTCSSPASSAPVCTSGLPYLATAAVAGAYFWVVLDLIQRAHSRELSPYDINRSTLRLVVAIPIGYAFTATFGDGAAWLAFLLGAFPIQ